MFIWLILHADKRKSTQGSLWLTEITNLSYTFLVIALGLMTILCSVYTAFYYIRRNKLLRFLPKSEFSDRSVFRQDNIPWYVKIVWIMYIIAVTVNFLVAVGYWMLVYNPCSDEGMSAKNDTSPSNSTSNSSQTPPTTEGLNENCSNLDAPNLHVHFVNAVFILVDLFLSRVPFQVLHFFYPFIFTFCYSIFTLLYWVGGGTDRFGNRYIYSTIDYSNNPTSAFTLVILLIPSPIIIYIILCPLALLRDFVYSRVSCCYRDVTKTTAHEYETKQEVSKNGKANGETTL